MDEFLRVAPHMNLASVDAGSTPGWTMGKEAAGLQLKEGRRELRDLQERLFASSLFGGTHSLLLVLQAMDTAGKGGIVRHVLSGVDPQGVKGYAFKAPTEEEKQHDFLWRVRRQLPLDGYIGVFDRSHYEDVLIHRVRKLSSPAEIEERYGLINDFEAEVAASGTTIVKVMLHISADEQKKRLQKRLDRPDKQWKYNPGDVDERMHWDAYQEAYELAIQRTSTAVAPWHVVPANRKWYARLAVQNLLLNQLRALNLSWPPPEYDVEEEKRRLAAS